MNIPPHNQIIFKTGLSIFATFFGAGSLMIPLYLGVKSGPYYPMALVGFSLSGILLTFLGIWCITVNKGSKTLFLSSLHPWLSMAVIYIITGLMGIFGVIPRIITVSFGSIEPLGISPSFGWVYATVFLALGFYCSYKEEKIIDIIAKILSPFKLTGIFLLLAVGIYIKPFSNPPSFSINSFTSSINEGYQLMDLLATFLLTGFFYKYVKNNQLNDDEKITQKLMTRSSYLGVGLIGITYVCFIILGAKYSSEMSNLEAQTILPNLAGILWGNYGKIFIAFVMVTSSLVSVTALLNMFATFLTKEVFKNHLPYKHCLIITCIGSFLMSQLGFVKIYAFLGQITQYIYPFLVVYCFFKTFTYLKSHKQAIEQENV